MTFIDTKSFFLFEIWSWETDPGSVLLRVLGFLNLSEGPKTRDPQSDPQICESQLTISWLRFQSGFASLLALETFIQSVSETYFLQAANGACGPSGFAVSQQNAVTLLAAADTKRACSLPFHSAGLSQSIIQV